jgi:hypothetical protein
LFDLSLLAPALTISDAAKASDSDAATLHAALSALKAACVGDAAAPVKAALAHVLRFYGQAASASASFARASEAHGAVAACVVDAYLHRVPLHVKASELSGVLLRILELGAFLALPTVADSLQRAVRRFVRECAESADASEWTALLRWRLACEWLASDGDGDDNSGSGVDGLVACLAGRLCRAALAVRATSERVLNADVERAVFAAEASAVLALLPQFGDARVSRCLLRTPGLLEQLRSVVRSADTAFGRTSIRAAAQLLTHMLLADAAGADAVWAEIDWARGVAAARDDAGAHMTLVRSLCIAAPQLVLGSVERLAGERLFGGVLHQCNTSRDHAVRVLAFGALHELLQLLAQHREQVGDDATMQRLFVQPSEKMLLLCFDTALDTFVSHLRDCWRALLALGSDAWLRDLVQRLAKSDFRRRSTLGTLSVCFAHRDVAALAVDANPLIVRDILAALSSANAEMTVLAFLGQLLAQRSRLGDDFWLAPCVDWLLEHSGPTMRVDPKRQHLRVVEGALQFDAGSVMLLLFRALWLRQRSSAGVARLSGVDARLFEPLVALLHATRKRSLVPALAFHSLFDQMLTGDGERVPLSPLQVLDVALSHCSASVRQLAFEALASSKLTDPMLPDEVALMSRAVLLTLKGDIGSARQMTATCLASFLARYERTATAALRGAASTSVKRKQEADADAVAASRASVRDMVAFVNELVRTLVASIYPGAVYQRVEMTLELLAVVMQHFPLTHRDAGVHWRHSLVSPAVGGGEAALPVIELYSADLTTLLLGKTLDLYDSTRVKAGEVMQSMPTPLPGLESRALLERLLQWALRLMSSLRGSEGDMGAQVLTMLLTRSRAAWPHMVLVRPDDAPALACDSLAGVKAALGDAFDAASSHDDARLHMCLQLLALLRRHCAYARQHGLEYAAQHASMHGVLIGIRVVLAELNVPALLVGAPPTLRADWRQFVSDTCALVSSSLLNLVLEPLHSIHEGLPGNVDGGADATTTNEDNVDDDDDNDVMFDGEPLRLVSSLCWITVKEAARCLSSLLDVAPLDVAAESLLTPAEVRMIGAAQVRIILHCQHKGGMERSYAAFVALCTRALSSKSMALYALPIGWLRGVLNFIRKPNRSLYHTRRSAGLPFIICAILVAERLALDRSDASHLLPATVRALLSAAAGNGGGGSGGGDDDATNDGLPAVAAEHDSSSDVVSLLAGTTAADVAYSAISVTQVHALNVVRALLRERSLTESMTPLTASAFEVVLDAFVSPVWGVRNSATMLFATLVDRTVGSGLSARDLSRMSFPVFFSRFSTVLPHIFSTLQRAHGAQLATTDANEQSRVFATLVLLSRLAPSVFDDRGDIERLTPLVLAFANHRHLLVRRVASRALAPLVSKARLPQMLAHIASLLPTDATSRPWRRNVVHGLLVHVQELLKSHVYAALVRRSFESDGDASVVEGDGVAERVAEQVQTCALPDLLARIAWMMTSALLCPQIGSMFFKLVHMYLQRSPNAPEHGDFVDLALRLLREPPADIERLPNAEEFLRRVAKVALFDALRTSPLASRSADVLLLCATHRCDEVRRTAFECVRRAATGSSSSSLSRRLVDARLFEAAVRETLAFAQWIDSDSGEAHVSHAAPLAAARVLPFFLGSGAALPSHVTLSTLWAALCRMAHGGRRRFGAAIEPALAVLGAVAGAHDASRVLALDDWIALIDHGSHEARDLSLRMATLESLVAARGVLASDAALSRDARARLWIAAARLIEDDDADIRTRAAAVVFAALPLSAHERASGHLLPLPLAALRFILGEFADTLPVRALLVRLLVCGAASADALALVPDAELLAALEASTPALVTPGCFREPWSETRAYFEIEPANTFVEPLVAAETAARYVGAVALPIAALQRAVRAQLATIKEWFSDVRTKVGRSARGEWLLHETEIHCAVRRVLLAARALQLGADADALVQWLRRDSGQFVPPTVELTLYRFFEDEPATYCAAE